MIWWTRIFFGKNHFGLPWYKKLKANIFGGYLADQYVLYDFDHNDPKEYLSEFDWYKSRYINAPYNFMVNNKVVCTEVLKHYVKVPNIFIIKSGGNLSTYNSEVKNYKDIYELLKREQKLFIKPISAGKGKGVEMFSFQDGQVFVDDKPISKDEFLHYLKKERDNWFLSEYVQQNDYLKSLYDKTTNTIRVITFKDIETKEFKIFFAVQRIGTSQTIPVDNASRGGLIAKIDLETGALSEAKSLHSLTIHEVHPDTGTPIKGVIIPNWSQLKEEVLALANQLPFLNFIAWDILLTKEGMCIIEANTSSGVNIVQIWGGQRQKELGDIYRHYNVIKK